MGNRRQEKLGWIGGWHGAFIWVPIVAAIFLSRGQVWTAAAGFAITLVASAVIFLGAPWRHPQRSYRRLMIPVFVLIIVAMFWAIRSAGDPGYLGFNSKWSLLLILPILSPFVTVGDRRWQDGESQESEGKRNA